MQVFAIMHINLPWRIIEMKRVFKGLGYFALLLLIILLGFFIYAYFSARPQASGELALNGLDGKVTVTRDEHGVPHIIAEKSDNDAMFALGFVHAQDRFWQMDFQRHVVQGRLSELFGPNVVKTDKFLRTLGLYRSAQQDYEQLPRKTKDLIHSYAMGVNAYIESGKKPIEFRLLGHDPQPWQDVDVIAFVKVMNLNLQFMWKFKIRNYGITKDFGENMIATFFPPFPKGAPTTLSDKDLRQSSLVGLTQSDILPDIEHSMAHAIAPTVNKIQSIGEMLGVDVNEANGSNMWVISGKLTQSGKPMLCNDPHLAFNAPGLWYLADIKSPTFHIIGATIPGTPGIVVGHNEHIAWGMTNIPVNSMDYYRLPSDTVLKSRTEVIRVKGGQDVSFEVQMSDHGPIVNDIIAQFKNEKAPIAYQWTVTMPGDTTAQGVVELLYANNWKSYQSAISKYKSVVQNTVYADDKGNIGYHLCGAIPIRRGWSGQSVVPADAQHRWLGMIPFNKLPFVYNPERGYILNANNKSVPDQYPLELTWNWALPPYRAMQLQEMIENKINLGEKFSQSDMVAMQGSIFSYFAKQMLPYLLQTKPINEHSQQALNILAKWDQNATLDSVAATLFNVWYTHLNSALINQRINFPFKRRGVPTAVLEQLKTNGKLCQLNDQITNCATLLSKTLDDTVKELSNRFGDNMNTWRWGKIHKTVFKGLGLGESKAIGWIWNRRIATPGSNFTPFMGSFRLTDQVNLLGPGYRQIVDFGDLNKSLYIDAFGASGNPLSSRYGEMIQRWRDLKYIPMSEQTQDWGRTSVLVLKPQ